MVFAVSGRLRFSQFLAGFLVGVLASSTVAIVNRDSQLVVAEDTAAPTSTAVLAGETTVPTTTVSPDTTIAATTTSSPTTTTTVVTRRDIRVLTSLRVKKRVAFITIDDGGYISPSVVSYLNKNKIPVTSFVMPEPLQWQWYKFRQMKYMQYGNHTNTHAHLRRLSFAEQKEEICRGKKLVGRISRKVPTLFRPPGGDWNETTLRAMAACGMRYLINWNVQADHQFIQMRSSMQLLPGDIILMHYKSDLLPSLKWVMEQLHADNLKPAFLSDYLKYG